MIGCEVWDRALYSVLSRQCKQLTQLTMMGWWF